MASAVSLEPKKKLVNRNCSDSSEESKEKVMANSPEQFNDNLKMQYIAPSGSSFTRLIAEMKQRLLEGRGECVYKLGISDDCDPGLSGDDMLASKATLQSMAELCDANLLLIQEKCVSGGRTAKYLIRCRASEQEFIEVRVAVIGNVDAGKSTLLGVLTHGQLDNGRGSARQKVFRHKHEMESGRTSSVSNDILGFDSQGEIVNKPDTRGMVLDWVKICRASSKIITFIDLAGHEKYLKTTISGMTGHAPDFCMLIIGANAGMIGMTKEHLGLALALNVPIFVVITKTDMCPENVLNVTVKYLTKVLKSPGCKKIPVFVMKEEDVTVTATNLASERICPIFRVSNVTGANLDLLKKFLNLLPPRMGCKKDDPPEFFIDETYSVPGVGTIISGTVMQGTIRLNDTLMLGPDSLGQFQTVAVKGIHRKRMPVEYVQGGESCSFALKKIKRSSIRKGMVLVSQELKPEACYEFQADIRVLHHPTTIKVKYQAVVHCGSMRQTASIVKMDQDHIRTGDRSSIRFRFQKMPEYLKKNTKLIFREGRTKAVGSITEIYPLKPSSLPSKQSASKHNTVRQ